MDELDLGAKRRLLGDLQQLQSLLDDSDHGPHEDDDAAEAEYADDEYASAFGGADDDAWAADAPDPGVHAERDGEDEIVEPPVLDDIVDPVPADFEAAAFEDTDWNQFVDQVFAQTTGGAPMVGGAGSTGLDFGSTTLGGIGNEDALLAELTQRLDARLAALRISMLAELEAMLARRGRLR